MIPDKIFSRLIKAKPDQIPVRLVQTVLDNVYLNKIRNPTYGIATLKQPRKKSFEFLSAVASRLQGREIIYKGGMVDFDNIMSYHLIRSYANSIKPEDPLLIKINETYLDYNLIRTFIRGKRMVYYCTLEESPVYISYNDKWWFYLSPITFGIDHYKLIEFNKKADLIDFFM